MQITFSPIIFLHTVAFTKSFHFISIEGHLTICLAQPLKFSFPSYEKNFKCNNCKLKYILHDNDTNYVILFFFRLYAIL